MFNGKSARWFLANGTDVEYNDSHSGMENMREELETDNSVYALIGCLIFSFLMVFFFLLVGYIFIEAMGVNSF